MDNAIILISTSASQANNEQLTRITCWIGAIVAGIYVAVWLAGYLFMGIVQLVWHFKSQSLVSRRQARGGDKPAP